MSQAIGRYLRRSPLQRGSNLSDTASCQVDIVYLTLSSILGEALQSHGHDPGPKQALFLLAADPAEVECLTQSSMQRSDGGRNNFGADEKERKIER